MEFTKISKGRGYKYASGNNLYSQYCVKKNITYLKCDINGCKGLAKIIPTRNLLEITEQHSDHSSQESEIKRLSVLQQCRKRAAEDAITPLRQIFDEETRVDH